MCLKSELDIFQGVGIQMGVDSSSFAQILPIASLSDGTPIEFYINGSGEHYLDLAHTILHLRVSIKRKNNTDLTAGDDCAPCNYFLNTLFSECSVYLNDKIVSSQNNYAYRAIFESLLFTSKSTQDSLLSTALFVKDTAGHMDTAQTNGLNIGYNIRRESCKTSKKMDLIGALHFDLANQPKLLINGMNIRIKLERNKDSFALMSAQDNYKIHVEMAQLFIRKTKISASVYIAHEKTLDKGVIKMPIRHVEIKTFALSSGIQSTTIANAFMGQLPTRLILGLVSNHAFNGSINKNPFNFAHYNLSYLSILNGTETIPAKPYQPDFSNGMYARSYLSLFTDLNRFHSSPNINISFSEYKDGYALYAFDLTPDFASGGSHTSISKSGNIGIDLKFAETLRETVNLIVYAEYRNTIEIDKSRGVYTDF